MISRSHVERANQVLAAGPRNRFRELAGPLGGGALFSAIGLFASAANASDYAVYLLVAGILLVAAGPALLVYWWSR